MRYQTELMRSILTSKTAQKIIDYVSPIYGDSYVGLWIFQAIGAVLDDVCTVAEQLCYETNASTTELLINYWERRYGLSVDNSLTIEQRRERIITKTRSRGSCTPKRLETAISAALGGVKVEVIENFSRNRFHVLIRGNVGSLDPAIAVIERMKPAHLVYNINVSAQTSTSADMKTAIAMTHSEKFVIPVEQSSNERDIYVDGETLVSNSDDVYVDGETLMISAGVAIDEDTLII